MIQINDLMIAYSQRKIELDELKEGLSGKYEEDVVDVLIDILK